MTSKETFERQAGLPFESLFTRHRYMSFKLTSFSQVSSDFCNICWTDELGAAPVIQLECGHVFHSECVKQKLSKGWPSARITFSFLDCALCKKSMKHPILDELIDPIKKLYEEIQQKALQRLQLLNLDKSPELLDKESKLYLLRTYFSNCFSFNNPAEYAMHRFCYFPCFKCKVHFLQ